MYTELFKKSNTNIIKYLQELGGNKKIYSERRQGLGPLFPEAESYIYATEDEIAIVFINPGMDKDYLEKDDVVWDLALTCELFRNRFLRLSKHVPHIFGVLLTSESVSEFREMLPVWNTLDIAAIGSLEGLKELALPVNTNSDLSIAFPLIFLYEAEFSEADYAYAEYSLLSLVDPDISQEERDEEMNYLREEFGLEEAKL